MASFISTVSAPPTPRSSAVTGSPAEAGADHHSSQPLAHVRQPVVNASTAMISLATAISKPVTRVMAFFFGSLADGDFAQHPVAGIHHAPPGDRRGVDVEARKAGALLRRQFIGIGLGDPQLFKAPQHHR